MVVQWKPEEIPSIIYDVFHLQDDCIEEIIQYESIVKILGSKICTNEFCSNINKNTTLLTDIKGVSEKCMYTEQELLFLLNNLFPIPYLKNNELINSPIRKVW